MNRFCLIIGKSSFLRSRKHDDVFHDTYPFMRIRLCYGSLAGLCFSIFYKRRKRSTRIFRHLVNFARTRAVNSQLWVGVIGEVLIHMVGVVFCLAEEYCQVIVIKGIVNGRALPPLFDEPPIL